MAEINCPNCQRPVTYDERAESKATKCPDCGTAIIIARADQLVGLKCAECGGALDIAPGMNQAICPFCNTKFLLPTVAPASRAAAPQVPTYLTPFKINREDILGHLKAWLNKGVFTAGDADTATVVTAVTAKYAPLYIFTADATSNWSGQFSTTHSRPVTRTRQTASGRTETYTDQEEYKEWHPTSGTHTGHYRVAISASAAIPQSDLDALTASPGNFTADEGAAPFAGVKSDDYPIEQPAFDAAEGWRRAKIKIDALERAACEKEVERLTSCATQVGSYEGRLNYHPFWWITYSYKGKSFPCLMDGRTGAVAGKKPKSKMKIFLAVTAAVILIILIFVILICVGGGYLTTTSSLPRFVSHAITALA